MAYSVTKRANFETLYRTYVEMGTQEDFIQLLDRLVSGNPEDAAASTQSSRMHGINRPFARLSHNTDAILEMQQFMRTAACRASDTGMYFTYTNPSGSNGTLTITTTVNSSTLKLEGSLTVEGNRKALTLFTDGGSAGTTTLFNATLVNGDYIYVQADWDSGVTQEVTLSKQDSNNFQSTMEAAATRLNVIPIGYVTAEYILWFPTRHVIHKDHFFFPHTSVSNYYAKALTLANQRNQLIYPSTAGDAIVFTGTQISMPEMKISSPNNEITVPVQNNITIDNNQYLYVDTSSGSPTFVAVDNNQSLINKEHFVVIAKRVSGNIVLWDGRIIVGSTQLVAESGTNALHTFDTTTDNKKLTIASNSDSTALTDHRTFTIDVNNADRTVDLAGNLTIAGNLTTQNNDVTINAVDAARTLTLNESLTVGGGNDGTITYSGSSKTLTVEDDSSVNQDLTTDANVDFNTVTTTSIATIGSNLFIQGAKLEFDKGETHAIQVENAAAGNAGDSLLIAAGDAGAGTDKSGGDIALTAGNSTGSAASTIRLSTAVGGSSSSTGNTSVERMRVHTNGNIGIGTAAPDKALEINHATGDCLRLTYNDSDGSASTAADMSIDSAGKLTITTAGSGADIQMMGQRYVHQCQFSIDRNWSSSFKIVPLTKPNTAAAGNYYTMSKGQSFVAPYDGFIAKVCLATSDALGSYINPVSSTRQGARTRVVIERYTNTNSGSGYGVTSGSADQSQTEYFDLFRTFNSGTPTSQVSNNRYDTGFNTLSISDLTFTENDIILFKIYAPDDSSLHSDEHNYFKHTDNTTPTDDPEMILTVVFVYNTTT